MTESLDGNLTPELCVKIIGFFRGVDRIISTNPSLGVVELKKSTAYGTASLTQISLNLLEINKVSHSSQEYLIHLKGVNYHELAHYIFGVDNLSSISEMTDKKGDIVPYLQALNDCRDETIFAHTYPKSKEYFYYIVMNLVLGNLHKSVEVVGSWQLSAFVLLYGRKTYLPHDLIYKFEKYFESTLGTKKTERAKAIIDEYLVTDDRERTWELASELKDIIQLHNPLTDDQPTPRGGGDAGYGRRIKGEVQRSKVTYDSQRTQAPISRDRSESEQKKLEQRIERAVDEVRDDMERLADKLDLELQRDIHSIQHNPTPFNPPYISKHPEPFDASPEDRLRMRRLQKILEKLRDELSLRVDRGQTSGRLDLKSAMSTQSQRGQSVAVFRRKMTDRRDSAKIAMVICLDASSSMDEHLSRLGRYDTKGERKIIKAKRACWAIAEAMERCENPVAILVFRGDGESTTCQKYFHTKTDWEFVPMGGTEPSESIKWGVDMLEHIRVSEGIQNLVLAIITDGDWFGNDIYKKMFRRIHEEHRLIETVEINVQFDGTFHGSKHQIEIAHFDKLPEGMKELVVDMQRKITRRLK